MNKDEIQKIWDRELIYCWRSDSGMGMFMQRFLFEVNKDLAHVTGGDIEIGAINDYLVDLKLRRCLDRNRDNDLEFMGIRLPVRAFVANHSSQLSAYLFSGNFPIDEIIENIGNFKWVRQVIKQTKKQRKVGRGGISRGEKTQ